MSEGIPSNESELISARLAFRGALLKSHETRKDVGEVEAAAARFCEVLRRTGHTPEATLIDAKRVIEEAIDGDSVQLAQRAILVCIQHYYGK